MKENKNRQLLTHFAALRARCSPADCCRLITALLMIIHCHRHSSHDS